MRKAFFLLICAIVIAGLFVACWGPSVPASPDSGVIRLHILANSDNDEDQAVKLQVRDMLLDNWGKRLASLESASDAWETLRSYLPGITEDIHALLEKRGASYGVTVKTGVYDFPERDYQGISFPAGNYRALRISLGDAAGKNWWCVMFPPLCLIGNDGEMSIEQYKELVRELDRQGKLNDEIPEAPVRSWFADKLFGKDGWDKDFLQWAKEFWLGRDD